MKFKILPLEERIVLDAAAIAQAVVDLAVDDHSIDHSQDQQDADADFSALMDAPVENLEEGVRVLVVSSRVNQSDTFAGAAKEGVISVQYDAENTSLEELSAKITLALNGQKADSIAFATHGQNGMFHLTERTYVSENSLSTNHSLRQFWQDVADHLTNEGRVDLLGCNLAQDVDLLDTLDGLLDVDGKTIGLAASTDLTGTLPGANWMLEAGNVDAMLYFDPAEIRSWYGELETFNITGRVFQDLGTLGTSEGTTVDPGFEGGTVYLFRDVDDDGAITSNDLASPAIASTTTDVSGGYSFEILNGNNGDKYWVVVDSNSLLLNGLMVQPEQSYGPEGSLIGTAIQVMAGDYYGGRTTSADSLSPGTDLGNAEHVANVTLGSTAMTGLDFGFSYEVIANTNNSGQGSLYQMIENANLIGPTSYLTSEFRLDPVNLQINVVEFLNYVITTPINLDATTQPGFILGDLSTYITVDGGGTFPLAQDGFQIHLNNITETDPNNTVIKGFQIQNFSDDGIELIESNQNVVISQNVLHDLNFSDGFGEAVVLLTFQENIQIVENIIYDNFGSNGGNGIVVFGGAHNIDIVGNQIGVDLLGNDRIIGYSIQFINLDSTNSFQEGPIISDVQIEGNTLFGGSREGLWVRGVDQLSVLGNTVNNHSNAGVYIEQSQRVQLTENTISSNFGYGVVVYDNNNADPLVANTVILNNQIFGNDALGIDLGGDGPTLNDSDLTDNDTGPNQLQNFPTLFSASLDTLNNEITIEGELRGNADTSYTIEYFFNPVGSQDPSGYGEGDTRIGVETVTTDPNGFASLSFTATQLLSVEGFISATATELDNSGLPLNTSEFSANVLVELPSYFEGAVVWDRNVDGDILDDMNQGIENVQLHFFKDSGVLETPDALDIYLGTVQTANDGTGSYQFYSPSLANGDKVWVVVDADTFPIAGTLAEQTYGPNDSYTDLNGFVTAGSLFGGRARGVSDGASTDPADLINAQHLALLIVDTESVLTDVNFGFSYEVITHSGNDGQGSLRQMIENSNALGGFEYLTSEFRLESGDLLINLLQDLPTISQAVRLDATTQDAFDSADPTTYVTIDGGSTSLDGFFVDLNNANGGEVQETLIQGFQIQNFLENGIELGHFNLEVRVNQNIIHDINIGNNFGDGIEIGAFNELITVENNVIFETFTGSPDPINGGNGIVSFGGAVNVTIRNNRIGLDLADQDARLRSGLILLDLNPFNNFNPGLSSNEFLVEQNEIFSALERGIYSQGIFNITFNENRLIDNAQRGLDVRFASGITISNNEISFAVPSQEYGMNVESGDEISIFGNTITGSGLDGLRLHSIGTVTVDNNEIRASGANGITVSSVATAMISDNVIADHAGQGVVTDTAQATSAFISGISTAIGQDFNQLTPMNDYVEDQIITTNELTDVWTKNTDSNLGLTFRTLWFDTRGENTGPKIANETPDPAGDYIGVYGGFNQPLAPFDTNLEAPSLSADGSSFQDGVEHAFEFNDGDGSLMLFFDPIALTGTNRVLSFDYWVNNTSYEIDDSFSVSINGIQLAYFGDVELEGDNTIDASGINTNTVWNTLTFDLDPIISDYFLDPNQIQLQIVVDTNAAFESIFVDNILFTQDVIPEIVITQNSIFNNGGDGGIDRGADGLIDDPNFALTSATLMTNGELEITGEIDSQRDGEAHRFEIFANLTADPTTGEGQYYIGSFDAEISGGAFIGTFLPDVSTIPTQDLAAAMLNLSSSTTLLSSIEGGQPVSTSEFSGTVAATDVGFLTGRILEDVNADAANAGEDLGLEGVIVRLYLDDGIGSAGALANDDSYLGFGVTGADGRYTILVSDPLDPATLDLIVAVQADTIDPVSAGVLPEQTYSPGGVMKIGGETAGVTDGLTDSDVTNAQHLFFTEYSGPFEDIGDFGFSFEVISNTNDSGQGSFRQFLVNSNALYDGTPLTSEFRLTGGGPYTIGLQSVLPVIVNPVILDATIQTDYDIGNPTPVVILDGSAFGSIQNESFDGLTLSLGTDLAQPITLIKGFDIRNFADTGISIDNGSVNIDLFGNIIQDNGLGTNTGDGISLFSTQNIRIGGAGSELQNLIRNNSRTGLVFFGGTNIELGGNVIEDNPVRGIQFQGFNTNITIQGNNEVRGVTTSGGIYFIDSENVTVSGSLLVENNALEGIYLGSTSNISFSGLTVSNNGTSGLVIESSDQVDIENSAFLSNIENGISIMNSSNVSVTGANQIRDNLDGVSLTQSDLVLIEGNYVESNQGWGVSIDRSTNVTIQGGNEINTNSLGGVLIDGRYEQFVQELTPDLPVDALNDGAGGYGFISQPLDNGIVVLANINDTPIRFVNYPGFNTVQDILDFLNLAISLAPEGGNFVAEIEAGLNPTRIQLSSPDAQDGFYFYDTAPFGGAGSELITYLWEGQPGFNEGNFSLPNMKFEGGIGPIYTRELVPGFISAQFSDTITVSGNYIGTNQSGDDLGNVGHGIEVGNAINVTVNGNNTIAFNEGDGVLVKANDNSDLTVQNTVIYQNSIHSNGGTATANIGIDLVPSDGQDQNDGLLNTQLGNNGQDQPELTSVKYGDSGLNVVGNLNFGTSSDLYRIDYYANDDAQNPEGQVWLGFSIESGGGAFSETFIPVTVPNVNQVVTATATALDSTGNTLLYTSEFSNSQEIITVALNITDATLSEDGGAMIFTVELEEAVDHDLLITYETLDGTASVTDNDYVGTATGSVTLSAQTLSATITILIQDDLKVEVDENFLVNLTGVSGDPSVFIENGVGVGTIENDDSATISITLSDTKSEGENLVFDVTLDADIDTTITLDYQTEDQTATAGVDYTALPLTTLSFTSAGTQQIQVAALLDNLVEADETFLVRLLNLNDLGRNVSLGNSEGTGTITSDDSATLSINNVSILEGDAGTTEVQLSVTLDQEIEGTITLQYLTQDGTATLADGDYQNTTGILTFTGPAESQTITVLVFGDTQVEPDEYLDVILSDLQTNGLDVTLANSSGRIDITDDDNLPPVANAGGPYTVEEGADLTLDGTGSFDPDSLPNPTLIYRWDIDGDGSYDVTGATPTISAATLSSLGLGDGPDSSTIKLQVDDGYLTDTATVELTVSNAAPTILGFSLNPASLSEGQEVIVTGTFDDPARLEATETFTGTATWSDGVTTLLTIDKVNGNFTTTRTFVDDDPSSGTPSDLFTVEVVITDDDGGSATATSPSITVNNVAPTITFDSFASTINEGQSILIEGTITDPGINDTFTGTFEWSDGVTGSLTINGTSFQIYRDFPDDHESTGTLSDSFSVSVTIVDDDTGSTTANSGTFDVLNLDPTVDELFLSATSIDEGGSIEVWGTFNDAAFGVATETFTGEVVWSDGVTTSATINGNQFSATRIFLDDNPTGTPVDSMTVEVRITDDDGGVGSATSNPFEIKNVNPEITAIGVDATLENKKLPGEEVSFAFTFTDIGVEDTHTAEVDWGDGTVETVTVVDGRVDATHVYTQGGLYDIVATLTDDDTGTATDSVTAVITGVGVHDGVLTVVGTNDRDVILIRNEGQDGDYEVRTNFTDNPLTEIGINTVSSIHIFLCGGDTNHVKISKHVLLDAIVEGTPGSDRVRGGSGNDLLMGGDGDDRLSGMRGNDLIMVGAGDDRAKGGQGDDILFGGPGHDYLKGGNDDDILMGGLMVVDESAPIFDAIRDEWTRSDLTFAEKRTIIGPSLDAVQESDEEMDVLIGNQGSDWFWGDFDQADREKRDELRNKLSSQDAINEL